MSRRTRRCRCPVCGNIFFTVYPTKVYCDAQCGKSAQNKRRYQRRKNEHDRG